MSAFCLLRRIWALAESAQGLGAFELISIGRALDRMVEPPKRTIDQGV